MAVIDEFYSSRRNPGASALVSWVGAFLDERGRMNEALMAQRLKAADPVKLLELETTLRKASAELSKAKREAEASESKDASNLGVALVNGVFGVQRARTAAEGGIAQTKIRSRADVMQSDIEQNRKAREAMEYSGQAADRIRAAAEDFASTGNADSLSQTFGAVAKDENVPREPGNPKYDAMARQLAQDLRKAGRDDAADAVSLQTFGIEDEVGGFATRHPMITDEDQARRLRQLNAGLGAEDPVVAAGRAKVAGLIPQIGAGGGHGESVSTTTASPTEGGSAPTATGLPVAGIRAKGSAATVAAIARSGGDIDKALADIDRQIGEVQAERVRAKEPIFDGANYLLDNPFTYTDVRYRDPIAAEINKPPPRAPTVTALGTPEENDRRSIDQAIEYAAEPDIAPEERTRRQKNAAALARGMAVDAVDDSAPLAGTVTVDDTLATDTADSMVRSWRNRGLDSLEIRRRVDTFSEDSPTAKAIKAKLREQTVE